ncbi:acyltransferase family protein [Spongiivirga citrea]|uniref:DUF1624 domain-containing protein n=1 Tax=Spongiivirga citrea TaxID=1481457 RepID=A0A6M0CL32_9FLAO|nr:heparan-alpha-glucosaminide N-acetyltransferase domain-containing protein [Spongiivirga citrea]NER18352.1 DUF1624 domain-containing protein [Spongiivirga citrea]
MKNRIQSIDILRGLTIFLMIVVNTPGSWSHVYAPLLHAKWHGTTPTDLVFPSFLFIVGMSMFISFKKASSSNKLLFGKVLKRGLLILLIGLALNWFPFYHQNIVDLRIFGVLQRIALAFLLAGFILSFIKKRNHIIIAFVVLLLAHWGILYFFPVGADPFALDGNISGPLDIILVGEKHVYGGFGIPFDPEGLLGTLSSAGQVLLGYLVCRYFMESNALVNGKTRNLLFFGITAIGLGLLWNIIYPINKPLWTGSYVFFTSGIITLVWALLIWVIDIMKLDKWAFVFKVFGRNPLISYVLSIVVVKILMRIIKIEESNGYALLYQKVFQPIGDKLGSLLFALSITMLVWLFAYWLYKKGKVIRV